MKMDTYIGLDMGKTKLAAGLVTEEGKILRRNSVLTDWSDGGINILDQSRNLLRSLIEGAEKPKGIGIGCFALVDQRRGVIIKSSVKSWINTPLSKIFSEEFGMPTVINTDVEAACLAEYLFGAAKGSRTASYMTISSGIAEATIFNGRIWHGSRSLAGHIGHLEMNSPGTMDDLFSGWGMDEKAKSISGKKISTKEIFDAVNTDPNHPYSKIIKGAVRTAGAAVAWINNLINPDVIVIGGSIGYNQKGFVNAIKSEAERIMGVYMVQYPSGLNVLPSALGSDNGIIGAALLPKNEVAND